MTALGLLFLLIIGALCLTFISRTPRSTDPIVITIEREPEARSSGCVPFLLGVFVVILLLSLLAS